MSTRRDTILKLAKGYYGRTKNCYKLAANRVLHGLQHAYRSRKEKKRMLRRLWGTNINASTQEFGVKYSQFMQGLALAGVQINRKVLAELAKTEPLSMRSIVECSTSARKQFAEEYDEQALLADMIAEKLPSEYFDFEKVADVAAFGTDATDPREEMKSAQIRRILDEQARETAAEDEIYEQRLVEEMKKKKIPESERSKSWSL